MSTISTRGVSSGSVLLSPHDTAADAKTSATAARSPDLIANLVEVTVNIVVWSYKEPDRRS